MQLLLHCDGTDASTTFTDSSGSGHTVTANGNAQIDTAQSKFGGAAALFDGTGDYLNLDGSSDFAFGTGDFTIDFWFRPNAMTVDMALIDMRPTGTNGLYPHIYVEGTASDCLRYFVSSANQITGATVLTTATWYHIALCRSGTSTRLFLNGSQQGSTYVDSNNYLCGANRPTIGAQGDNVALGFANGWIDELRIVKGEAFFTANFSVPTEAYTPYDTWPSSLPQCPILNGFSEQRQRNVVSFEPDVGPPKMRRRSTAVAVSTSCAFRMSTTQLAAFNTFYEDTLSDGVLPFDWAHPITKVTYTWMFDAKEAPRIDRMSPAHHRVTFNLLRLPA